MNALKQYIKNDFNYLVYSTADILVPPNIFAEIQKDLQLQAQQAKSAAEITKVFEDETPKEEKKRGGVIQGFISP